MAPKKEKHQIEYRLLVMHIHDDTQKKDGILFLLETTKLFTNFNYFIDIHDEMQGNVIRWNLHGLRAPSMNLPATGTAQFRKIYFDAPTAIKFTLIKKENNQASTEFKVLKSSIKCNDTLVNFLKIYTDPETFESGRIADTELPEYKPDVHRIQEHSQPKKKKS